MSEVERWWRDDSSVFHLRDAPLSEAEARTVGAKKEESFSGKNPRIAVADFPLNNRRPAQPQPTGDLDDSRVPSLPRPEGAAQPGQVPKATAAAATPPSRTRSQNAGDTLFASAYQARSTKSSGRRSAKLWTAILIQNLLLGAIVWYVVLVVRQNNISVAQLPGINRVYDRAAELDRRFSSDLQVAATQAQTLADRAKQALRLK
jgi:hypothetical protein